MTATRIYTYDSTLRDGEQCEGITLSLADKLAIVRRLDEFGIDYIEGGFPASNPKDVAFFREVAVMDLKHAQIAAFGSTCKKGVAAAEDPGLADLIACGAPVVTIVGKTWDAQVERALQTTLEENLRMIGESVAHLKAAGRHVVFDAEHYFDGFKANRDYALACVGAAVEAGADSVDLCETNGGALPFEVEQIVAATVAAFPSQAFGIHCHNDSGCAVANTLAAVRAGATQVQGTVNGIGERVGNTQRMLVSELAGKASLLAKARSLGFDLEAAGVDVQAVLDDIKAREAAGFTYEVADGSLGLLLMRHLRLYAPAFTLESFRVIVDDREDTGALAKDALSEATVKIHVGEGRFVATGESAGPVGALDAALRMAIVASYPQVEAMELIDYKVRLLDESQGTDAITRVTITATDGVDTWGTVGVSENVIEASWNALVDSLEYGLFRARVRAGK